MEVGAVKQAFNNEVILLKRKLNQAKIQIIHKLTRKAKQLTGKKASEQLQEKLKRKAESAVKEVLIIKKIKPKDLAKFIVTHKGELNTFLNKPQVDEEKACARLLLHKALQDKYKFIRGRFSNVPIQDLFMSRIERRKLKKEAKEKQKNKKKGKNNNVVNSEGDWNVEDMAIHKSKVSLDKDSGSEISGDNISGDEMSGHENDNNEVLGNESDQSEEGYESEQSEVGNEQDEAFDGEIEKEESDAAEENSDDEINKKNCKTLKTTPTAVKPSIGEAKPKATKTENVDIKLGMPKEVKNKNPPKDIKKNPMKKHKELNKAKHFNEKILQKKLMKDSDAPVVENKIVDPFFITSTGENYMSVVEPRAPDEIKEEHMRGNRKLRRAVKFGLVPKSKLRQNNNFNNQDRFNKQNGNNFKGYNDRPQNERRNFNDRSFSNHDKRGFNTRNNDDKPEKLHPSWEAKRKKSGILPFEGKKIVFDES